MGYSSIRDYLLVLTGIGMNGETLNNVDVTELTMTVPNLWVPGFQGGSQNLAQTLMLHLQSTARVIDLTNECKLVSF